MQPPRPRFLRREIDRFQADPASLRNATVLTISVTIAVVVIGSLVIWLFGGQNYPDFETAFWFTLQTITTVGYGDRYPVTTEGRIIAAGVMAAGVGLLGVLSGLLAAWFMEPVRTAEQREEDLLELRTVRQEMSELRRLLEQHANRAKTPPEAT